MRNDGCGRLPRTLRWVCWISLLLGAAAFGQDVTPPSPPSNLKVTPSSSTGVVMTWTASTDDVGVTGYQVERCQGSGCTSSFTQFNVSSNSWANTGLTPSTTYGYRVRAKDAVPNYSGYTNIVYATTAAAGDTQAPSTPSGLTAVASSSTTVVVNWNASTDNVAVTGYQLERCQGSGCTSSFTTFDLSSPGWANSGLTAGTTYGYRLRAKDAVPNYSDYTNIVYVTTDSSASDTQAPSLPGSLSATANSSSQVSVGWNAATDNVAVTGYQLERCTGSGCNSSFTQINVTSAGYADTGRTASTTYGYRVRARDAVPNYSTYTNVVYVTTPASGPAQPAQVRYGYDDAGRLRKRTSARDGYITNYKLDAAGNRSNIAITIDSTAPTTPSGLTAAVVNQTTVTLRWTASSDGEGAGVVNYSLERCSGASCSNFAQLTAPTSTDYSDVGIALNTPYSYRVRALDGVGLWSEYSNVVTVVSDTMAPNPPTGLAATTPRPTQVNLTWTPATDPNGSGIANQMLWRCTGTNCSAGYTLIVTLNATANSYSDTTVTGDTVYHYYMTATDVAGNVSSTSTVANLRTPNPANPELTATVPDPSAILLSWTTYDSRIVTQRVWRCVGTNCAPGYTLMATLGASATSYSDPTLYGLYAYHYYVTGHDSAGAEVSRTTVASLQVNGPDTLPPSIPQNLTTATPNPTTVNLAWSDSSDNSGGSGVQGYQLQRCTGSGCTNFASLASPTTAAYGDTTVSAATTYRYRVRALDRVGNASDFSSAVTATTPPIPDTTPPNPPTGLTATNPSAGTVNLTWVAATDPGGSGVVNQKLWRCTGTNCSAGYTLIVTLGPSATSYSDTGLAAKTPYHYYLTATDAVGNVSQTSTVANIMTDDPANPTLSAVAVSSTTIALSWMAPADSRVVSQIVWRCTGSNCAPGYTKVATLSPTANSYSDATLSGGTWYHYYVTAVDASGRDVVRTTVANLPTP